MGRDLIPRHIKGNRPSIAGQDPSPPESSGGSGTGGPKGSGTAGLGYKFLSAIVQEVISNPEEMLNRIAIDGSGEPMKNDLGEDITNLDILRGTKSIENAKIFSDFIPMNSIVCHIIDDHHATDMRKDVLCYPFFPPHLSLPVKPGEYVWIIQEDPKGGTPVYYWMCRKVSIRQVDDLNITHMERQDDIIDRILNFNETKMPKTGEGALSQIANFFRGAEGSAMPGDKDYDTLHLSSTAFKEEFTSEPVPRQSKNCGDLLLQGSNNSHIMLGTERFVLPAEFVNDDRIFDEYAPETFSGETAVSDALNLRKPMSPAIDLCIGRKIADLSTLIEEPPSKDDVSEKGHDLNDFGILVGRREAGSEDAETFEVDKLLKIQGKDQNKREFVDYDPTNCLARIYMTNSPKIDEIFGFPSLETSLVDDNNADLESENYPEDLSKVRNYGTATVYGQNIRVRSDATMKLYNSIGQSMITMTPEGDIVIQANTETGGKIVLEAEGDIRIVPGETGVVKIGDDLQGGTESTAGLVPVATKAIPGAPLDLPGSPRVNTAPVVTSGGGVLVGAGTGVLSKKVIIF